jgi:hypothetical protein
MIKIKVLAPGYKNLVHKEQIHIETCKIGQSGTTICLTFASLVKNSLKRDT